MIATVYWDGFETIKNNLEISLAIENSLEC
jgi:hypothetical protein